jgi:hypothetical protein
MVTFKKETSFDAVTCESSDVIVGVKKSCHCDQRRVVLYSSFHCTFVW